MKNQKTNRAVDYEQYLLEDLKNLDYAVGYLTSALEEGEDVFLLAVRNVAKAHGGMKALSDSTNLNRESLYDSLSKNGNPRFFNMASILDTLGIELSFKPKTKVA